MAYRLNRRYAILYHLEMQKDRIVANPTEKDLHDVFRESLHAEDDFERGNAAAYVKEFGEASVYFVDDLIRLMDDPSSYIRHSVASSLLDIGKPAQAAIPVLIREMERYPDHSSAWFAAEALGKMADRDDSAVIEALIRARDSGGERLHEYAKRSLDKLGYGENQQD